MSLALFITPTLGLAAPAFAQDARRSREQVEVVESLDFDIQGMINWLSAGG